MGRWTETDETWDDEAYADSESDDLDLSDDGDDDDLCIPCPYCQCEILEESERCPHCGHYLSREDAPISHKPLWFVVGLVACFYAVYRWTCR